MSLQHHHRGGGKNGPPCGPGHLQIDQACLQISSNDSSIKYIFEAVSTECDKCSYWTIGDDFKNGTFVPVNTTYGTNWKLSFENETELCQGQIYQFGQYGRYDLNADTCHLDIIKDPSNPYLPILWAALILAAIQVTWVISKRVYNNPNVRHLIRTKLTQRNRSGLINEMESENQDEPIDQPERSKNRKRVKSLDAFRGLAIVIMIFVNYGGGGYAFFAQ